MKFNVVEIGLAMLVFRRVGCGWLSYRLLKRRDWWSGNAKVDKIEEPLEASVVMNMA